MRKFNFTLFLFASALTLKAQSLSQSPVAADDYASKMVATQSALQAKMHLLEGIRNSDFLKKDFPTEGVDLNNSKNFKEYFSKIQESLRKRLSEIDNDATQKVEANRINQMLNTMTAATCLEERKDGSFVRQRDMDGQEVVAYPLDSLRTNARYGLVESFKEGFSRIKKDQVFGFLNLCGDEVIPCQYETAESFNGGRALVKKVVWYFVDGSNNESDALLNVVEAKALTQGISMVKFKDGKYAFVNNKYDVTKKPISALYDDIKPFFGKEIFKVKLGNQFGLINIQGQVMLPTAYEFIEPSGVTHLYRVGQAAKIGLVDTMWKIKFEPIFSQILDFDPRGIAWAKKEDGYTLLSSKSYKSSRVYKNIAPFNKLGIAQIMDESNLLGLINLDLQVIIDPRYASISEFNDFNLAAVSRADKKFGFINTVGVEIIVPAFDEVGKFNNFGVVIVKEENRDARNKSYKTAQVYNKFGAPVITKTNDTTGTASNLSINYEFVDTLLNGKYMIARKMINGEYFGSHLVEMGAYRLITQLPYQEITDFDESSVLRYKYSSRWGLMDTTGRVILQPTYIEIRKPGEGYYAVKDTSDRFGFIDKRGKIQIPFEYVDVKTYKKGNCVVKLKDKQSWGLINKFNAKVVPCYFKTVNITEDKIEMFDDKQNKYVIDDKGDCLENCSKFEELRRKANQLNGK